MTNESTDRFEQVVHLKAPRSRVWQAISRANELATWFRLKDVRGELGPGATVRATIGEPGYEHLSFVAAIVRFEPERVLAWRWHPGAPPHDGAYDHEPTTLVEFQLEDEGTGTRLTIRESGFDALPPARRDPALRGNREGWAIQAQRIARHVEG